jgi:hypothetical protein
MEDPSRFVVRFKQIEKVAGRVAVQCRSCNLWVEVPKELI